MAGDKNIACPPVVGRPSYAHNLDVTPLGSIGSYRWLLEPHRGLTSSHQDGPT